MAEPNYKKESDLTPTERFILDHGTPRQKASLGFELEPPVQPYSEKYPKALPGAPSWTGTNTIGAFPPEPEGPSALKVADDRVRQWQADHPLGNYALQLPNLVSGAVSPWSAVGQSVAPKGPPLPSPSGINPQTPTTPQPMMPKEGQPWTAEAVPGQQGVPVGNLPNASTTPSAGGGRSTPGSGLGSDKAIQNTQRDQISGAQAIVDKKMDEGSAAITYLGKSADAQGEAAVLHNIYANAQKQAGEETFKEQEDFEKKKSDAIDKAAKMGVDPGRVFRGREAASAIILAIGGAVAGFYQGMTNGAENQFVKTVQQIVQTDIQDQDKEIAQADKHIAGMETTYQNLVRRGVDKRAAIDTYYGQVLDSSLAQLNAALAKAKIPEQKANIEGHIQALQNERTNLDRGMQEYWKNINDKRAAAAAAAAERLFRHGLEMRKVDIDAYNAQTGRLSAEGQVLKATGESQQDLNKAFFGTKLDTAPNGAPVQVGIVAASPENRGKLEEAAKNHETSKKAIAEIRRLRGEGPKQEGKNTPAGGMLGRGASKQNPFALGWERGVNSEGSALKASLNKGAGLGAYDTGTAQLLEARVGDLTSVGAAGDQLLDQLEIQSDRDYHAFLNANGGRPAARVYNTNSKRWEVQELPNDPRAPAGEGVGSVPGARKLE